MPAMSYSQLVSESVTPGTLPRGGLRPCAIPTSPDQRLLRSLCFLPGLQANKGAATASAGSSLIPDGSGALPIHMADRASLIRGRTGTKPRIPRAGIARHSPLLEARKGTTFVHGSLQPILRRGRSLCRISPNSHKQGRLRVPAKR